MPHPDYPKPEPADLKPALWLSAPGDDVQVGLSRNKRYMVRVSAPVPPIYQVRVTTRPDDPPIHPDSIGADSPACRDLSALFPPISMSAVDPEDNPSWKHFAKNPQLARVIATAIYRMQPLPWPS